MTLQRRNIFRVIFIGSWFLVLGFVFQSPAFALTAPTTLSIEPLTWNVIGLDSNDVTSGPNDFPIGARVCNTGTTIAENVKSSFVWTSSDSYIDFRPGTLSAYTDDGIMLDPGACTDFYYEVEVERNSNAYEHSRQYVIQTSADGGEFASTPANRELYVEYLISQSRNSVNDVQLDGVSIAPGGTMALMVGETYTIKLVGSTATNGYNQLESFINFPNTIFQILSVESTYSVSSLGSPIDVLYADSCGWENDLTDPNYLSCVGSDGKSGGSVTVTYVVKILQSGSGAAETLNTLLYDFSGSSFHYNADFSVSARNVEIIDPNSVDIAKNFSPDPTNVGGTSKLTFTLSNPNPVTVEGASFSDTFPTTPGAMVVADPAGISTAGCGTPIVTAVPGAGSISVSGATIAPNSNCTISLNVSVPAVGTYENTTSSLKYYPGGEEIDTGNTATDTLEVNTSPPAPEPICGVILAAWDMENETAGSTTAPTPSVVGDGVSTATAAAGAGVSDFIEATTDLLGNPTQAWTAYGWTDAADDYLEFVIDTSNFTNVEMDFSISGKTPPGPDWFELFYLDEGTGTYQSIIADNITKIWVPFQDVPIPSSATGNTYLRIYATGASNGNSGSDMSLDDITIHGCGTPSHVTLTKSFTPDSIQVGATSTLTFAVNNPNNVEVTNVSFNDELPSGVVVAGTPAVDMTGCGTPTFSPTAGSSTLSFSGGTIAATGTCTVSVDVTATTAGPHTNVSGFVSSTQTGTNTDTDGYATDDLTALLPPVISKAFGSTPILVNETSLLTFTINNPNQDEPLTGINFTDNYPAGVVNANPLTPAVTNTCGGIVTAVAGADTINLSGGNLAGGDSCTVTVTVTSATAGTYLNTSGNVSSTNGGIGNTASAELKVNLPSPGISMLKTVSTSASGPWTKFVSVSPGDEIYYRFLVENIGDVPFSPVTVNDPSLDTSGCTFTDPLPVGTPTEEPTSTCVIGPFSAAEDTNVNTATADGTYGGTLYTSDPSSATYVGASPSLSLLKEISLTDSGPWSTSITGVTPAANVYYRFTITNTGNVPLETVSVDDPKISTAACSFTQPLGAAESTNCVVGPVTAETVVGVYTNTAAAHGTYKYDSNTYDSSPASASYTLDSPDLVITKTNDVSGSVAAGNTFNWTLTVTNQGTSAANFTDGATLISDTLPAGATYGTPTADNFSGITNSGNINCGISSGVLTCSASGANVSVDVDGSFTVAFQVTTSTAGDLVNTATVDPGTVITESNENNNDGSDTVTVINATPAMTVAKSSTTTTVTAADQVVPYSYTVTNTGDVTLTNVTLADDNTDAAPACSPNQPATLAPTEKMTCTASHTVTQDEINAGGNLTNIATADSDQTEAVTDTLNIPISGTTSMTVAKSSTTTSVTAADQVVPYSYTVTNTGTVTLTNVTLADDNTDAAPACSPNQPATLAPTEKMTCTA
ncbi:DUF11 domain-containing protein, partial [bacterium]|nr:DUF11 domain-containing protein [bacterium]